LQAGRRDVAERLMRVLEALASDTGLIAEQVWDAADIPERELFFGKPSGSAMPLVWALLCLAAAAARSFLRRGRLEEGLLILENVPVNASYPFAVAQLARAAAMIRDASGEPVRAAACLERAAEAAMRIPNPGLCAEIREDLAYLHERDGRPDVASTERLRAAALYRRAGYVESALALIDAAIVDG
jgi:tetratricopeptide (TPR) repeat protein